MIILIGGSTHTGKTKLAQTLLEKYHFPYLSIDHLKMGLIRSNNTDLTPLSNDSLLTDYLWPIVVGIIKTAIENKQNLIIEGCYIPFDYQQYFELEYLQYIKYYCLIMSKTYIKNNFDMIAKYANVIENRITNDLTIEELLESNKQNLELAKKYNVKYILIDHKYEIHLEDI